MTDTPLTVLQVSPSETGGGAEKVAYDLMRAYRDRGLDSWLAVGRRRTTDPHVVEIPNDEERPAWTRALTRAADGLAADAHPSRARWALDRALRTAADPGHMLRIQRGLEDFDFPGTRRLLDLTPRRPDILHLHNLHGGYFDIRALPALSVEAPMIITLHDVWLLTGHCAYPMTCERWLQGCGECPDLGLPIPIRRDASERNAQIKRAALAGGRVHLATPSRWLADLVERSGVAETVAEVRVIPNGVDTDVFSPGDKAAARAELGLPEDAFVLVFAANAPKASPFKGFETLEAALPLIAHDLEGREVLMLAVGQQGPDAVIAGVPVRAVPFLDDPADVARYYRAADVYVHPANAESFGLAVAEAMACGTPVVAADSGGVREVLEDGVSGLLVETRNPNAMARAVCTLASDGDLRSRMSLGAVRRTRERFRFETQVERYLDWYAELRET